MDMTCLHGTLILMLPMSEPLSSGARPRALKEQSGSVMAVAFSLDGKTVASGCKDRSIKLWDPQTGALRQTWIGPETRIESLAFSPDGKTLASGSGGPEALIWLWEVGPPRE
jgi:WD40 repeat protein